MIDVGSGAVGDSDGATGVLPATVPVTDVAVARCGAAADTEGRSRAGCPWRGPPGGGLAGWLMLAGCAQRIEVRSPSPKSHVELKFLTQ